MYSVLFTIATLASAALASPLTKKDVHCGTTADATLSDCQALTGDKAIWDAAFNENNVCRFTNVLANVYDYAALNVACHGNCCVYVTGPSDRITTELQIYASSETLRQEAAGLLGCGDASVNKVNGMQNFGNHAVCVSNGDGCSDCFDDADYAF